MTGGVVKERLLPEESELQLRVETLVSELDDRLLHVLITRWSPAPCSTAAGTRVVAVSRENTFSPTWLWPVSAGNFPLVEVGGGDLAEGEVGLPLEIISNLATLLTKSSLSNGWGSRGEPVEPSAEPRDSLWCSASEIIFS